MKTIYIPIKNRLKEKVPVLYIDLEKGQLKKIGKDQRPDVKLPCALISITLPKCEDIEDTIQDCEATITVRLAFDPNTINRTSSEVEDSVLEQHLEPYDLIADVYSALQGFETDEFDQISRRSQGEEANDKLFVYKQVFKTKFEDVSAEK